MSELEVEAVDSIPETEAPDAPEYVLYGGKGGVGKTTMAAATALASAQNGIKTLVVSTDPAHSVADVFETEVSTRPEQIRAESPLWAVEIDPETALEDAGLFGEGGELSGLGGFEELLGSGPDEDDDTLAGMMPGADEAAAMQQLLEYLDDPRFDRVVVDTAPTGHTLRLLELPELLDTVIGRLMTVKKRFSDMMAGLSGMFGEEAQDDGGPDIEALRARVERLRRTLRDPALTDFRIVMVPEAMSVLESRRLRSQLEEFELPVGTVIVNRVMEEFSDVAGTEGEDVFVSPDTDACEFCRRRWDVQRDALTEAQELFRDTEVKRVPLFADEVRGTRMLRVVGACVT